MINNNPELRKFGLVLGSIILVLFAGFSLLKGKNINQIAMMTAGILILTALVFPPLLAPVQKVWIKLGHVLGMVNTGIILGLIFFFIFTPIAILRKLIGKDPLDLKIKKSGQSFRTEYQKTLNTKPMEKMF